MSFLVPFHLTFYNPPEGWLGLVTQVIQRHGKERQVAKGKVLFIMTTLAEGGILLRLPIMGQGTDLFFPFKNIEDHSL